MSRLTITLSDERHRALKEAAAHRGRSIGEIIEASLDFYGIKPRTSAADLVARARAQSGLDEETAMDLAVEETRAERCR
jgi:hypothetical protein